MGLLGREEGGWGMGGVGIFFFLHCNCFLVLFWFCCVYLHLYPLRTTLERVAVHVTFFFEIW